MGLQKRGTWSNDGCGGRFLERRAAVDRPGALPLATCQPRSGRPGLVAAIADGDRRPRSTAQRKNGGAAAAAGRGMTFGGTAPHPMQRKFGSRSRAASVNDRKTSREAIVDGHDIECFRIRDRLFPRRFGFFFEWIAESPALHFDGANRQRKCGDHPDRGAQRQGRHDAPPRVPPEPAV